MKSTLRKVFILLALFMGGTTQLWADGGNGVNIVHPSVDTNLCPGDSITLQAVNNGYITPGAFTLNDDEYSSVVPIGFNFNFYGNTYSRCVISSNGYIAFDTTLASTSSPWAIGTSYGGPGGIPGNTNVKNCIMGVYSDLLLTGGAGGNIKYGVAGTAPNRRFVVSFCTSPLYSCTSLTTSFQIILYETSNIAEVHIRRKDTCSAWNEAAAIEGVQDATGAVATVAPGHNYPGAWAVTSPEGARFTPNSSMTSYTYSSVPYNPIAQDTANILWFAGSTYIGTGYTLPVLIPSVTTTYRAIAFTCTDTSSSDRIISTLPVRVSAISGPDTVCTSSTITLTDSVSGGNWVTLSSNITVSSSGVVTGVAVGPATVYYYIYNSCGGDTVSKNIYVTASANPGTITGVNSVCLGSSTTLLTSGTGGGWSSTNPAVATVSSSGVVTPIAVGTTIISYAVRNACGPRADTQMITVLASPAVGSITGSFTVCSGNTTALADTPTGGTWSSASPGVASVSTAGVVTGVAAGTAIITYDLVNSCGSSRDTALVTVIPTPGTGPITGPSTVCLSGNITLADTSTGGTWSSTAPTTATVSSTGVVTGLALGSATISYTVTNTCGTSGVAKVISVVNSTGSAGPIIGPSSVCIGATITMTDTPSGGTWSNAFPALSSVNPITGTVTGRSSGIDTIIYSVVAGCGNARATKIISVNTVPVVTPISGPASVCAGGAITLTDASTGGSWSSVFPSIATVSASGVVTGITAGVDTIKYTVSNTCGNTSATYVVTVNTPGVAGITGPTTVCAGTTIALADTTAGGVWSSGAASVASVNSTGTVTGVAAGTAVISYTVTNACGTQVATKSITVNPAPNAGVLSGPT
ncbi:MAG: hypothetical protein EBZ77_09515, partial [Chitinophagia bacterium]|nr:hypothetical protein [Chitinophagia bacterium]